MVVDVVTYCGVIGRALDFGAFVDALACFKICRKSNSAQKRENGV